MKLLIVDDHPLVRKGLISILSNEFINEIKETDNVKEAIDILMKDKTEIAMIDLRLGHENGLDIVTKAKEKNINTKFIILTSFISEEDFNRAEQIGVEGYVLKEAFTEDILYAMNIISRGKKYYSPELIEQKNSLDSNKLKVLTSREKEILKELEKGRSNEEIARSMFISEFTVKKHVSNILAKLNLKNRAQVAYFINSSKDL